MQTAVVGTSTVRVNTEDATGAATTPSVVTVTGTADDGATVTLGSPSSASGGASATMTVTVPTLVTLTWVVDGDTFVDEVDVIGRMPVTVKELRDSDSTLTSTTPAAAVDAIELAHEEARSMTGWSWVRRYDIVQVRARSGRVDTGLHGITRVGKVVVGDTTWTAGELAEVDVIGDTGVLALAVPDGALVTVGVEHGKREPSPRVRWALLARAGYFVRQAASSLPLYTERVVIGELNTVQRLQPSATSTGTAEVDAVYRSNAYAGGVHIA